MPRLTYFSLLLAASQLIAPAFPYAQTLPTAPAPAQASTSAPANGQIPSGGIVHGTVKSGNIPLPGVTVTAQNTLTGKTYYAATSATGAYSMTIPHNGRYVIRAQFAAFAAVTHEALLNAATHDLPVDFNLILASRAQ